ncbi:MAG: MgtC/SapB family protein [Verrucomicrobiota bacterium]
MIEPFLSLFTLESFGSLFSHWKEELGVLIQAVVALALGGLLGWERESSGKIAGLRTHMLVCLAAMLFVKLGQFLITDSAHYYKPDAVRADPIHIIGAIATGISFLGAGTIFRDRDQNQPQGLTTAASLLCTGSLGVAVAIDRYVLAVGVTLLTLFTLRSLQKFAEKSEKSPK